MPKPLYMLRNRGKRPETHVDARAFIAGAACYLSETYGTPYAGAVMAGIMAAAAEHGSLMRCERPCRRLAALSTHGKPGPKLKAGDRYASSRLKPNCSGPAPVAIKRAVEAACLALAIRGGDRRSAGCGLRA